MGDWISVNASTVVQDTRVGIIPALQVGRVVAQKLQLGTGYPV